jgi:hypothetical protein
MKRCGVRDNRRILFTPVVTLPTVEPGGIVTLAIFVTKAS